MECKLKLTATVGSRFCCQGAVFIFFSAWFLLPFCLREKEQNDVRKQIEKAWHKTRNMLKLYLLAPWSTITQGYWKARSEIAEMCCSERERNRQKEKGTGQQRASTLTDPPSFSLRFNSYTNGFYQSHRETLWGWVLLQYYVEKKHMAHIFSSRQGSILEQL